MPTKPVTNYQVRFKTEKGTFIVNYTDKQWWEVGVRHGRLGSYVGTSVGQRLAFYAVDEKGKNIEPVVEAGIIKQVWDESE